MRIKIENVGILEAADVDFTGIAVIAGHNDTGKSTVSKVAYALVRAITPSREELLEEREGTLLRVNAEIQRIVRKNMNNPNTQINSNINRFVEFDDYCEWIISSEESSLSEEARMQLSILLTEKKEIQEEITVEGALTITYNASYFEKKIKQFLEHEFKNLWHLSEVNYIAKFSLFTDINFRPSIEARYSLFGNSDTSTLDMTINAFPEIQHEYLHLSYVSKVSPVLTDAIYIGTPLVMDEKQSFQRKWESKSDYLHYHLQGEKRTVANAEAYREVLNRFKQVMLGEITYQNGEYSYKKDSLPASLAMKNTATGIKTFGILQILIEKGHLDSGTLLIIDEPEVHLHPDWQVKLAEILVLMSQKLNIPILLSTHAPFFLEAINLYALTYKYDSFVKFHIAKISINNPVKSIIEKAEFVDLLSELAEPFSTLEALEMALEKEEKD